MTDIIAFGEILIDFTEEGKDCEGFPSLSSHIGGAPLNFLTAATKKGAKCALISKVGDDAFGKLLLKAAERRGIDVQGVIMDKNAFTTLAFVTHDETGDRDFSFARKPGADTLIETEEVKKILPLFDNAKIFHFGTLSLTDEPSKSATKFLVEEAKKRRMIISFDPNYRAPLWKSEEDAKKAMLWGLEQADIVKIADNEVNFLFDLSPFEGAEIITSKFGAKLCAVTMGPNGAFLMSGHERVLMPAPKVNVVDTTGAGDIFGGTMVPSLILCDNFDYDAFLGGFKPLSREILLAIGGEAVNAASASTERVGGA